VAPPCQKRVDVHLINAPLRNYLSNIRMRSTPIASSVKSAMMITLGCVMTFVRYREDQWLAVKL
jgi:hypothetical protein